MVDYHISIIICIMILCGAFGGFLNYLHNFDTTKNESELDKKVAMKYILLGIGASLLVPAFLKMISSNLITNKNNEDYLIFAGFCIIAAIFSRRFILTIGDKILEAAKNAQITANENKLKIESTHLELTSAKERIEDVKLALDLKNTTATPSDASSKITLEEFANSYVEKTSIPIYSERIKLKAELGRKMGEIIIRNNLSKEQLLLENKSEGMLMAITYSVQLQPEKDGVNMLNQIAQYAKQLYTHYSILIGYDTLARNSFIEKHQISSVYQIINSFKTNADPPLLQKIHDTKIILSFIEPEH
ncbi:YEATS-associated helix-containing protein [Emticicia fluvialis]|uniref:YEATS-associated helix-containing protein n=1 Tax=Emticicia fluvialis TaxID=2974474 RepID=UPI00216531A5|nr:YEATS-associated helix-containing protein [Emticicia fluvialis]